MYYTKITTKLCEITLIGDEEGLRQLYLHTASSNKPSPMIGTNFVKDETFFKDIILQLQQFLSGKHQNFDVLINPQGTTFQKTVWEALRQIPYGQTRTYKQVASIIGNPNASRAIGMASSNNPLSLIIPCHRVIGTNGKLTGFASGLKTKQQLLTLENDGRRRF